MPAITITPTPINNIQSQILSSSIWTPLGVIIPAILVIGGGGFGLYKYIKSRQYKNLSYSIVNDTLLANLQDGVIGTRDIKVMVEGKKVQNVRFVSVRIRNSGNIPIKQDDFEEPLWFLEAELVRSRTLIDAGISGSEPANIPATTIIHSEIDKAGINKLLLNPGDSLFLYLLLSDYSEPISIKGRIVGVKEIKQEPFIIKQQLNLSQKVGQFIAVLLILGVLALVPTLSLWLFLKVNFVSCFMVIMLTFLICTMFIYVFSKIKQNLLH